jgi:hypothetical protein
MSMESIMSIVIEWSFTLLLLLLWFVVRCVLLIIRVCIRYWCTPIQISLAVFAASCLFAGFLALIQPAFAVLAVLGFSQLVIIAKVVEVSHADVLMKEPETMIGSVLHTNWFQLT